MRDQRGLRPQQGMPEQQMRESVSRHLWPRRHLPRDQSRPDVLLPTWLHWRSGERLYYHRYHNAIASAARSLRSVAVRTQQ